MNSFFALLSWPDTLAFIALFLVSLSYRILTTHFFGMDIGAQMKTWRLEWARQIHWREERITDIGVVRGLIGNVSFFATTTVFVISGLLALLGASGTIVTKLNDYPHMTNTNSETFALKICAMLLLAVMAFFKFGWAMRLHAYTLLFVGAAPNPDQKDTEHAQSISERISEMSYLASKHYLDGVRAYYLGLSALTWIISAWLFLPTLLVVVAILVRRDFFSEAFKLSCSTEGQFKFV